MRVLIIRPAALGDTLMLGPALSILLESGEVIVAGRKPGIGFLRCFVSDCVDFEGPGWHALFVDPPEPDVSLPLKETDKVIAFLNDPQGVVRKNLEHFFPGASIAVLPGYPGKNEPVHVALHLARALERCGLPVQAERAMKNAISRPLLSSGHRPRRRMIFHPGSGGAQKNHAPEFWLELTSAFCKRTPSAARIPLLLLGPAEAELLPLFSGHDHIETFFSPSRDTLALLLEEASLYVGHDSGVTHLAAMLGAPTIALFRNSSVEQWRPLGPKVKVIQAEETRADLLEQTLKAADGFLNEKPRPW